MNDYYFTHFEHLFDKWAGDFYKPLHQVAKESTNTVRLPNYPPCDCVVSEDRNILGLRFAMAGYNKEDIGVTANEGSITLSADAKEHEEGFQAIHNGISKKAVNLTVSIDPNYDARQATTKFENGMLIVQVPIKKEAKSVTLM